MSAFRAVRVSDHDKHGSIPEGRGGAGNESTGSHVAGMAKKITGFQAAKILGITDRHLRRWRERYEQFGFDSLLDRRR